MKRETVHKFLNNTCMREEAEQVIDWLGTPEGQRYLGKVMSDEIEKVNSDEFHSLNPQLNSSQLYRKIQQKIDRESRKEEPGSGG